MTRVALRIERLVFEVDDASGEAARRVVEEALARLEARLRGSPFERWDGASAMAIEKLTIDTLPADEILGPRGAERLADELYAQLTRRPR